VASTRTAPKNVDIPKGRKAVERTTEAATNFARAISTKLKELPEGDAARVFAIVNILSDQAKPGRRQSFTPPEQNLLDAIFAFKDFSHGIYQPPGSVSGWRDRVLHGSYKTPDVMKVLGLSSRQSVIKRADRKEVLAIKDGRDYYFPRWQFDDHTDNRVVEGLPTVLRAMSAPPIMIAAWLTRENENLGASPLRALSEGRLEEVLAEAKGVGVS